MNKKSGECFRAYLRQCLGWGGALLMVIIILQGCATGNQNNSSMDRMLYESAQRGAAEGIRNWKMNDYKMHKFGK